MTRVAAVTRADARLNHDRLLAAARAVLAERGLGADVVEVALRAGVGVGTVYRNYPSKEALFLTVAHEMAGRTTAELNAIAGEVEDARVCIARTMQVGFARLKEYGMLAIELVGGTQPPQYDGVVDREELGAFFARLIRRGVRQGHFRSDVDVEYAVAVWFALVAPQALSHLMDRRSVDEIAALTTDFLLAGISARPARS